MILGVSPIAIADGTAGLLTDDGHGNGLDLAQWARCGKCGQLGVYHFTGTWRLRPCGHYDGDALLNHVRPQHLTDLWAHAGSMTQWRPGRRRPAA